MNVEQMRCHCGDTLAMRDHIEADSVAGVPDSGTAHAIGYANRSGIPFARPFIKYTPTWPRSFMPPTQSKRNLIARMKLIPVDALIRDKRLILIDDSLVRGTQLRETTEFLYHSGAKEVHIRLACPPITRGCKYLNFSRSKSELDLISRRVIRPGYPPIRDYGGADPAGTEIHHAEIPPAGRHDRCHRLACLQSLHLLLDRPGINAPSASAHLRPGCLFGSRFFCCCGPGKKSAARA